MTDFCNCDRGQPQERIRARFPQPDRLVLKFAPVRPGDPFKLPARAHPGDAGLDLYVSERTTIWARSWVSVAHNIAVELPPNTWALMAPRSSTFSTRHLICNYGIIDQGYRGELRGLIYNPGEWDMKILNPGDRIFQLIPMPLATLLQIEQVGAGELEESVRGASGWGSSGK